MQGTKDRTTTIGVEQERGPDRSWLVAGALALALLSGGVAAGVQALGDGTGREAVVADAPEEPAAQPAEQEPVAPAEDAAPSTGTGGQTEGQSGGGSGEPPPAPAPVAESPDVVAAGTYGVRVLGEGWDEQGRHVVVDRGRISDGPPAEPGVDGTKPVLFDTGAVAERRRVDLADGHDLRFARSGGQPSHGPGSWADLVTEIGGRTEAMLATIEVDADGQLTSLVEPYRP